MNNILIEKLRNKEKLTRDECSSFIDQVFQGSVDNKILTEVLILLNKNGFSSEELTGFAKSMRLVSKKVVTRNNVVDNCGTGGDGLKTFNISTTASLIASCSGACVAKHGNKAITSSSGSADLLKIAGINLNLTPEQVSICLEQFNFGFMFAPLHHSSMKYVAESRKTIAPDKTIFNLLGPLTNPASARRQLIGVYSKDLMRPMAETLINLGTDKAMIVHSHDGLDEISIYDKTYVLEIDNGDIKSYDIEPRRYFNTKSTIKDITVNDAVSSLKMMMDVLNNIKGPAKDICLINAAALVYISGNSDSIEEAIKLCDESIKSRSVYRKLQNLVKITNSFL